MGEHSDRAPAPFSARLALDRIWDRSAVGIARRRRGLQIALGLIWLLDAALQFQPFMFGQDFVATFLVGSQVGDPQFVKSPMGVVARLVSHNPALFNTAFALIQLALAVGILWRPTIRPALAASIVWSLAAWWFGEGMGGVFYGATPVMGYPGAVLLYALIAVSVWPPRSERPAPSVAASGPLGGTAPRVLWFLLWASFVRFLLLSANRSPQALKVSLAEMAPGEPGWERAIDNHLATTLANHGTQASIVLAVACAAVALAVFVPLLLRPGLVLASVTALAFWVAQDFGGEFTSYGTDPNTGPLLVLLTATLWPDAQPTGQSAYEDSP